ncbi:MAG TPA: aminotransferase class V-fold PLP-dependent enzyme [Candidatus Fermentibacter daniensis]|jgi:cysteine desulfurase family protein|nr:aminotransferase class V-fold PLP-dependent enzyme [Bacillota bacterium]HOA06101.1 aminotransferase class V-fold PLP-dependent enzyme [Candidatus Fermentibacter daniensis]HOD18585.1 aminotransferase class V-fold PLP-dependent enzyme [Candidatus Fermentibacter daniensis]HOZ17771.1 aminotransferase class V-fold PLP-dependent enzyme [Candidatus Fermentibacter daniensis]HPH39443.1 aminotransferase class V-fold PLP-dependent enzyme [Candidatus Fermentibacter daniensis]
MDDLIYLDNSATSFPKPQVVYDFMKEFYQTHGVSPGRSGFDRALEAENIVHGTRKLLTNLFNGTDPNRLSFSYNATDSLNRIIMGMLSKGDHVISTNLEHNSVLRPLNHLQRDGGVEVTYIPFDSRGYVDPDDIEKAFRKNTRLVIVNHSSNIIGTVQPIGEIGRRCRKAGIYFAVDASQSAGAVPIDVQAMCIDLLAFTGHKCLMGPTGIGGAYVGEDVPIRCTIFGGTGVRSLNPFHLDEFPYRMEAGTLNTVGVAGLNAGVNWVLEQGMDKIHAHEIGLWDRLRRGVQAIDGVTTYCADDTENQNPVLSLNIHGFEAGDVGTMLDVDHGIAVRTGLQCAPQVHVQLGTDKIHGTVRFSVGPFNTEKDIDRAIAAVGEIAAIKR